MTAITTVAVSSTHTTLTVVATAFCYYFATVLLTLQTGRVHCSAFAGVSASFITPTFSVRSSSADGARTRRGICSSTSNYRVILPLVNSKADYTLIFILHISYTHTCVHARAHTRAHTRANLSVSVSNYVRKEVYRIRLVVTRLCVFYVLENCFPIFIFFLI